MRDQDPRILRIVGERLTCSGMPLCSFPGGGCLPLSDSVREDPRCRP